MNISRAATEWCALMCTYRFGNPCEMDQFLQNTPCQKLLWRNRSFLTGQQLLKKSDQLIIASRKHQVQMGLLMNIYTKYYRKKLNYFASVSKQSIETSSYHIRHWLRLTPNQTQIATSKTETSIMHRQKHKRSSVTNYQVKPKSV